MLGVPELVTGAVRFYFPLLRNAMLMVSPSCHHGHELRTMVAATRWNIVGASQFCRHPLSNYFTSNTTLIQSYHVLSTFSFPVLGSFVWQGKLSWHDGAG